MSILLSEKEMAGVQGDKEKCLAVIEAFDTCKCCSANCHDVARAQLRRIMEWGKAECFEHPYDSDLPEEEYNRKRNRCPECWETLEKEAGG